MSQQQFESVQDLDTRRDGRSVTDFFTGEFALINSGSEVSPSATGLVPRFRRSKSWILWPLRWSQHLMETMFR